MSSITCLSLWEEPDLGAVTPTGPPFLPPHSLSPVSSSRKARQRLASRGSRTQLPAPAAHSSRRLCPARPSSMQLRSCKGTARVGCSQLAGGPLWRKEAQSSGKECEWHENHRGAPTLPWQWPYSLTRSPLSPSTYRACGQTQPQDTDTLQGGLPTPAAPTRKRRLMRDRRD